MVGRIGHLLVVDILLLRSLEAKGSTIISYEIFPGERGYFSSFPLIRLQPSTLKDNYQLEQSSISRSLGIISRDRE